MVWNGRGTVSAADRYSRLRTGEGLKPGWAGVMQVANGLLAAGAPEPTIRGCLLEPSNEGARYVNLDSNGHVRPTSTRERFVRDALRKARIRQSRRGIGDRGEAMERLAALRDAIDNDASRWKGTGGATDRAVLMAAFDFAAKRGALTFTASIRELADVANVGIKGAWNATGRLSDWLTVVQVGRGTLGTTFRFNGRDGNPLCPRRTEPEGCRDVRTTSDVWRWEALGKSTARVFSHLGLEPRSAIQLAELLEVDPRTVRRHLAKLKVHGLAARVLDGWIRGPADLELVAEELGVFGRGTEQRSQHRTHSEQRRAFLESRERTQRQRKEPQWWAEWWGSLSERSLANAA